MRRKIRKHFKKITKNIINNAGEISWFLTGSMMLSLAIFVNPWFLALVVYGLLLRSTGYCPQYFFFGNETKKFPVGKVFDAKTGKPLSLAVVRLYNKKDSRLLQTKVTNTDGIFDFLLPQGHYFVEVVKQGYQFPTNTLNKGYSGETIKVSDEEKYTYFQYEIFLDPAAAAKAVKAQEVPVQITKPKFTQTAY